MTLLPRFFYDFFCALIDATCCCWDDETEAAA